VSDTRTCSPLPSNTTNGTQVWDGVSAYGACTASACAATYHVEGGVCVSDTRTCSPLPSNTTAGTQTWNSGTSTYGSCTATTCDATYHVESGVCVSDTRSCSAPNATAATETWNGSTYIDCTATACASTYHIEFGACVSDTRSCSIANGSGSQNYVSGAWGTCTLVPGSCTTGYHTNGNACEADVIGYCANLSATTTATLGDGPKTIFGELFIANATNAAGAYARSNVKFQYGSGATGSNASGWSNWVDATYDSENGNNDQYRASVAVPSTTGASDYAFRASTNGGTTWTYCMTGNAFSTTYDPAKAGVFTTSGETIDFCNTQFPTTINSSVSTSNTVYGQVYLAGKTNSQGTQYTGNGNPAHQSGNIRMQFGYGLDGSAPSSWATWTSTGVNWNAGSGGNNNDEYQIDWTTPAATGRYDYLFRASGDGGATWTYCDTDGSTTGTGINAPGDNLNTSGTAYTIDYGNLQFPTTLSAINGQTTTIYGQVYIAGGTNTTTSQFTGGGNVVAQFGYGAASSAPSGWTTWTSTGVTWNAASGVNNNDEYQISWLAPPYSTNISYGWRYSGNGGVTWTYGGTAGITAASSTTGWGAATMSCLLISDYVEGFGNRKGVEIWNCGPSAVTPYASKIKMCQANKTNGGTNTTTCTSSAYAFPSTGTGSSIAAGGVLTICNSSSPTFGSGCDVSTSSQVFSFNGDDRLGLFVDNDGVAATTTSTAFTAGDTLLDAFGMFATSYLGAGAPGHFTDRIFSRTSCERNDGTTGFPNTTWTQGTEVNGWSFVSAFTSDTAEATDPGQIAYLARFRTAPTFTCP
jgi:hypothetical protein